MSHICVMTPAYGGQVTVEYAGSLLRLQQRLMIEGVELTVRLDKGDSLIPRARNSMASEFIKEERYTHLLWIDADIGFEPEAVVRMHRADLPVVAGVYPLKKSFPAPEGVPEHQFSSLRYVVGMEEDYETCDPCFMTVREAGTGFMLIQRNVFQQLIKAYPERGYHADMHGQQGEWHWSFFNAEVIEGRLLSEDYLFCHLWRAIGGKVWADLDSRLTHVGSHSYQGDWQATNAALAAAGEGDRTVELIDVPSQETGGVVH